MRPLKGFVTAAAVALAAATISTSANAGWSDSFLGVGPNNNGWGVNLHPDHLGRHYWGMDPQQDLGFIGTQYWGMNPQQNVGIPYSVPWMGINPQQNVGWAYPGWDHKLGIPAPLFWGMNPQQNVGFAPPWFGVNPQQNLALMNPIFWGMNPQQNFGYYPFGAQWGTTPQSSFFWGMNPQQNVSFMTPEIGMPQQQGAGQPAQQAGIRPVQCSINNVAALTKSVDDCEKAGGDVPSSKSADAGKN